MPVFVIVRTWIVSATDIQDALDNARPGTHQDVHIRRIPTDHIPPEDIPDTSVALA